MFFIQLWVSRNGNLKKNVFEPLKRAGGDEFDMRQNVNSFGWYAETAVYNAS